MFTTIPSSCSHCITCMCNLQLRLIYSGLLRYMHSPFIAPTSLDSKSPSPASMADLMKSMESSNRRSYCLPVLTPAWAPACIHNSDNRSTTCACSVFKKFQKLVHVGKTNYTTAAVASKSCASLEHRARRTR